MKRKDLTYYSIMYGGVPMSSMGSYRYMTTAMGAGYPYGKVIQLIPDDFLSAKGVKDKREYQKRRRL